MIYMKIVTTLTEIGIVDNKYLKVYINLMLKNKERHKDVHMEKHHIVPVSLGGSNMVDNLVYLTYREHFLAHRLLVKITTGKSRSKMCYSLWWTAHGSCKNKRIVTSRQVAIAKHYLRSVKLDDARKKLQSINRLATWMSWSEEQRQHSLSNMQTPEANAKRKKSLKEYTNQNHIRAERSARRKSFLAISENLEELRKQVTESWDNPDIRKIRCEGIRAGAAGDIFKNAQKRRWEEYWEEKGGKPIHHDQKIPCEICGKKVKMLTRHVELHHNGGKDEKER